MDIRNPHDKFFKEVFSDKETAVDFLKNVIPDTITTRLDFKTIKQEKDSYIDEELKEYYSDVIYRCMYNGKSPVKIVLLFEHKSYVPDYPHIQLFKYLLKIWEKGIKDEKRLIPVLPLIFYHGVKKWEKRLFSDYFVGMDDKLQIYVPELNYLLTDLSDFTDSELIEGIFNNIQLKIAALIMKNIFDEQKLKENLFDFTVIGKLYFREKKGLDFLKTVIRYLLSKLETITPDMIRETIERVSIGGGKEIMTIAESLIEKGKLEGKIEEKLEIAKKMLASGLSVESIVQFTSLSVEELTKLR